MRTIVDLFGHSPIAPLRTHMDHVAACVKKMAEMWKVLETGDADRLEVLCKELSDLEHETDKIKNEIRRNVPNRLFMAVDRGQLLKILSRQDDIADICEDIGVLMTLHPLRLPSYLADDIHQFVAKNIEAFEVASQVGHELQQLMASSFGGTEAEKVRNLSDECALREHEADLLQRQLLKNLLAHADSLSHAEFFLWRELLQKVAGISDASESLAKNIRLTLDT